VWGIAYIREFSFSVLYFESEYFHFYLQKIVKTLQNQPKQH